MALVSTPSARTYLDGLDSSEFLRRAGDVRELLQHPGWGQLRELVAIQAAHVRSRSERDPLIVARSIAADPIKAAVTAASAGGEARGLEQIVDLAEATVALADQVQQQIERENEGS